MAIKKILEDKCEHYCNHNKSMSGGGNGVYCFGMIGAAFYFLQNAHSISDVLMGIFYAIFWPAVLAYQAFSILKF